jgi:hypothetical protein
MPDGSTRAVDQVVTLSNGIINVRETTITISGGVEVSRTYHRHVVLPGEDYSNEDSAVRTAAASAHTSGVVAAYEAATTAAQAT